MNTAPIFGIWHPAVTVTQLVEKQTFVYVCNNFEWWWPYWPIHAANDIKTKLFLFDWFVFGITETSTNKTATLHTSDVFLKGKIIFEGRVKSDHEIRWSI